MSSTSRGSPLCVYDRTRARRSVAKGLRAPEGSQFEILSLDRRSDVVSYATTSDRRSKDNISNWEPSGARSPLATLRRARVRSYTHKGDPREVLDIGFVADELYEVWPIAVVLPEDPERFAAVD